MSNAIDMEAMEGGIPAIAGREIDMDDDEQPVKKVGRPAKKKGKVLDEDGTVVPSDIQTEYKATEETKVNVEQPEEAPPLVRVTDKMADTDAFMKRLVYEKNIRDAQRKIENAQGIVQLDVPTTNE